MIAIIDYGVGNLFSLKSSLDSLNVDSCITSDKDIIKNASKIILPGVGAFSDAMKKLKISGLDKVIKEEASNNKPILGICLGMQMLFEKSYEFGEYEGLGLLKGCVVPISDYVPKSYKIPHIGWNKLIFKKESKLFKYIKDNDYVYFVHSYFASDCECVTTSVCEYKEYLTASVEMNNVYGCQFHPEKSGSVGLNILKAFCEIGEE